MTTLLSSRGATRGRTRWLLLNQCVDVNPKADLSPPSSHRPAPHPPRAPPPPPRVRPPPRSPILRRRSPLAPQLLRLPLASHAPPPPPATSSPRPENGMKRNQ
jgi:hypothetical protein